MPRRTRIGFALGAGSARGWAHIGVLAALAEAGIRPDFIAGCSIGALVGAAFAVGRLTELEEWVEDLDWRGVLKLLDLDLRGGLIKGHRVVELFRARLVECNFSELGVPFAAVATDLSSGQEVWLREGKVSEAVRASIAVPGLFQPTLRDGRYLVDGSVVNPVPVSLCRAMGADIVIAVDLGSDLVGRFRREDDSEPAPDEEPKGRGFLASILRSRAPENGESGDRAPARPSLLEALMGSINIMQVRIARSRLAGEPPDLLIAPRLGDLGLLDFHRGEVAIAEGRDAVARMLPAIRDVLPG